MKNVFKIAAALALVVLFSGCTGLTKNNIKTPDPALSGRSVEGARFALIVDGSNWTEAARDYYPNLFENDFASVPVYMTTRCKDREHIYIAGPDPLTGAMAVLLSFAFPFPMDMYTTSCDCSMKLAGAKGWLVDKPFSFGYTETNFFSLNPIYWIMMPFFNSSSDEIRGLKGKTIVQAAFETITQADPAALSQAYSYRRSRLGTVKIYGRPYWFFLGLYDSSKKRGEFDTASVSFWEKRPSIGDRPIETVVVAKRADNEWKLKSAYLRRLELPGLTVVLAELKNGMPAGVKIKENVAPTVEDLLYLDNEKDPSEIRWNNSMLIEAKNTTLPRLLRYGKRSGLIELINTIEKEVLHINELAQLSDSRAQQIVLKGGDPSAANQMAVLYRQRITIFKAILSALKEAVAR